MTSLPLVVLDSPRRTAILPTLPAPSAPAPAPAPAPALGGKQDCASCPHLARCWSPRGTKKLSNDAIVTNLLVCRIQLDIDRNRAMRLLLQLLAPKIKKTALYVARKVDADVREMRMEIESVVAESVMKYRMGQDAPPIVWLFNPRYGAVRHWVMQTLKRKQRERAILCSYDHDADTDIEERLRRLNHFVTNHRVRSWSWPADMVPSTLPEPDERHLRALELVDDGHTLNTTEYRIMKLCLRFAHGAVRLTDRPHQYLAEATGLSRKDVSRYYGSAWRKLLDALGLRAYYFQLRGHTLRRRAGSVLTPEDVHEGLSLLDRFTLLDVAWMLDVTTTTVQTLRRHCEGKTVEEIRLLKRGRHG